MLDVLVPKGNEKELISMAESLGFTSLVLIYDKIPELPKTKIKLIPIKKFVSNRQVVERGVVDFIYDVELENKREGMHQKVSGMNHVIAALLREKDVVYCVNFNRLLNGGSELFGRVIQNLTLVKKFKAKGAIASFASSPLEMRSPQQLKAVFGELLQDSKMESECMNVLEGKLKRKEEEREGRSTLKGKVRKG